MIQFEFDSPTILCVMKHILLISIACIFLIVIVSCGRKTGNEQTLVSNIGTANPIVSMPKNATVRVYFENTLGMDGYINGNTDFKDVFRKLLVALDNEKRVDLNLEFYLINDTLAQTDFGVEPIQWPEKLNPKNFMGIGDRGHGDFKEIFDRVLENQSENEQVISILMADFIHSPKESGNAPTDLNKLKTYTKNAVLNSGIAEGHIDAGVYRFTSDFNGTYYDRNNEFIEGLDSRPFYYFVLAPDNLMDLFADGIATELISDSSFENEALFNGREYNGTPHFVLPSVGKLRVNRRNKSMELLDYSNKGDFEFVLMLNMEQLPVSDHYLMNPNNYRLHNPEFEIKDIGRVEGKDIKFKTMGTKSLDSLSLEEIGSQKFTHAIVFSLKGLLSSDFGFSLRQTVPGWVHRVNSNDDQGILADSLEQTKTLGFGKLIHGISEAYQEERGNDEYFSIGIPIRIR